MDELKDIVFSLRSSELIEHIGSSPQGEYVTHYLEALGANTCVLEKEYIDKDFTIDYQKFYSRSFEDLGKTTKRIHVFTDTFSAEDFVNSLNANDTEYLNKSYLGFFVIRPIKNQYDQPLIGRTLLKPYPLIEEDMRRCFITGNYSASLFGIHLKIRSLPFQAKDEGVSACATIALWTALNPLKDVFEISRHSPAEITEMATSFPSFHRRFPSSGLTPEQMINYLKLMGLDVEIIKPKDDDAIQTAVKAYMTARLPILASLKMEKNGTYMRHAVTISGYKIDVNQNITELYVHDDVVGPYCRVNPNPNFKSWTYDAEDMWTVKQYNIELEDLRVPIYRKIRTTFWRIYSEYIKIKSDTNSRLGTEYNVELHLIPVKDYKKFLLNRGVENKTSILTMPLPRFLWIIRLCHNNRTISDQIYDTTSIYTKELKSIKYIQ